MEAWKIGGGGIRESRRGALLAGLLLAMGLLSACNLSFSPEQAVVQSVLDRNETRGHMQVEPATIEVLQKQSWQDYEMVLVAFQAVQNDGQLSECLFMYQVRRGPLGWAPASGGGGCGPARGSDQPIGIGAGRHGGPGGEANSHVAGMVYEEGVVAIEVVWDDDERQRVQVLNGSYLVVREGFHDYAEIRALNAADEVVFTQQNPPPVPGKAP